MKILNVITVVTLVLSISCEKPPGARSMSGLWVTNNGPDSVYSFTSFLYPDTSIPEKAERSWDLRPVRPGASVIYDFPVKNWKELFDQLPADTLSVFFFHPDTLRKHSWTEIRNGYKTLRRIDVSRADLDNLRSTILFP